MNRFAMLMLCLCLGQTAWAVELPKGKDVIEVPALGEGLCVHNLFQSNMVLQRGKPVPVWGWAAPGEKVTVSFGGKEQSATAGNDRLWKVSLPAMEANSKPQTLTVKGTSKTLALENVCWHGFVGSGLVRVDRRF